MIRFFVMVKNNKAATPKVTPAIRAKPPNDPEKMKGKNIEVPSNRHVNIFIGLSSAYKKRDN